MGVVRGDFEKVLAIQQGPRAAQMSTDVPDVGAPLRLISPALRSWGDFFGKMANIGTDYTRRKNNAERQMNEADEDAVAAEKKLTQLDESGRRFTDMPKGYTFSKDEQEQYDNWQRERDAAEQAAKNARRRANYARQIWGRTGFWGTYGTPDPQNNGNGPQ